MRKINIILISILYTCALFSQSTSDSIPVLPSDEVEVVKSFEAITKTVTAVFPPPGTEEEMETGSISSFNYFVQPKQEEIEAELPNLRPLAYTTPVEIEKYDGFLSISFANPNSPKLDYAYNYNIEDWFELGFLGNYFSADDEQIEFRDHRDHSLRLYGKYVSNSNVISRLDVSYNSSQRFFYANAENSEVLQDELARSLLSFQSSAGIDFDFIEESGLRLDLGLKYRNTDLSKFGQHEHLSMLTVLFQKIIGEHNLLEMDSDLRYYVTDPDLSISSKQFLGNIKSKLYYNTQDRLKANLGFDVIRKQDSWAIQPNIDLRYTAHNRVYLLAGAQSISDIYDVPKLFDTNSFVSIDNAQVHTHTAIRPYLGMHYLDNVHSLKLMALYNRENGLPLFGYKHVADIPMYSLIGLDVNYYSGALDYALQYQNTKISLGADYRFTDDVNLSNWRTQFRINQAVLNQRVNIFLHAELLDSRIIQKLEVIRLAPQSDKIYDLTLGTELRLNSNFSLQAKVVNLIGKEYQDWYAYPVFGRQFRAGAFVKF